jgi:putative DNA primase/helicase
MTDEAIRAIVDDAEEWSPDNDNGPQGTLRQLTIGSDVDIAGGVAEDLRARLGDVISCEGSVWRYAETHWSRIEDHELRLAVHRYDGVQYLTQNNSPSIVRLGKARVDSILTEMGAMLARPNFFDDSPPGINCASGFIQFGLDGEPSLEPHHREHRCRHVLKGSWNAGDQMWEVQLHYGARLGLLLEGVFHGDEDAEQKVALLQEIAGAVAVGYGTRLRRPKAVILAGATAENGKSQVLDLLRGLLPPEAHCFDRCRQDERRALPPMADWKASQRRR